VPGLSARGNDGTHACNAPRREAEHSDAEHNDAQHNDAQHNYAGNDNAAGMCLRR
jgi:hypothetical protein